MNTKISKHLVKHSKNGSFTLIEGRKKISFSEDNNKDVKVALEVIESIPGFEFYIFVDVQNLILKKVIAVGIEPCDKFKSHYKKVAKRRVLFEKWKPLIKKEE